MYRPIYRYLCRLNKERIVTEEQRQYMLSLLPEMREIIRTSTDANEVMKVVAQNTKQ